MDTTAELRKEFVARAFNQDLHTQVLMDGRLDAEIIIIGEAPGSNEVAQKTPFIGFSGDLLWKTLRQHGILRTDCYATNVSKRLVSQAKNADHAMAADEWIKWKYLLQWELSQLKKPKIIFAMGNAALKALHGWDKIGTYRGSVYNLDIQGNPVQVLYTFNPAAVIREPKNEIIFQMDARRLKKLVVGDYVPMEVSTHHSLGFRRSLDVIKSFRAEKKPVSIDIETTSGQTACVGISNRSTEAFCINFRDRLTNIYTIDEEYELWLALQDLYEDPAIETVAQNGNFDSHWSAYKAFVHMPIAYDTLLAHHTLYPSLPHNLGFLTSQYTTHPYYKDELDAWRETGNIDEFWEYNCRDAAITLRVKEETEKELQAQGLYKFFKEHVMKLQPHLVISTADGIAIDLNVRAKIAEQMQKDVDAELRQFYYSVNLALSLEPNDKGEYIEEADGTIKEVRPAAFQFTPNPGSPDQMKDLLYNRLNLKHRNGNTDAVVRGDMLEDTRTSLEAKNVLSAINTWTKDAKFLSTYAKTKVDPDNRFRCEWKQYGVVKAPGRLSSSQTLWGAGMNMQNQPPKARQFYVADADCVLIYFDLSQAEARVVGYVADIEKWKEDFERARVSGNYDCHRALASDMFKIPYDDVPVQDEIDGEYTVRYVAKRCRHGLNYRMAIPRLAETTGLSYSRAASAFHTYHRISPEIQKWWAETERIVKKDRQLFNAFGRRWKLLQRLDDKDALESIVAFYPQSTIGDKVGKVWYQSHEDDRWDMSKARIRLNIHDALIGVAHKDFALTALSIMKKYAEEPILIENIYKTKIEPLIIPAETKISTLDIYDRKTKQIIGQDTLHRWSNLKAVNLEAAI